MRVPLSWLRDYVDVDLAPEQLAERLTLLGMEVKAIDRWGSDWRNVVVGELLAVEKHPRADRLSLTRVTIGDGEALEIVCGATNIAVGDRVPVALPGAVLPGERRIERTEKMGVVSNGMLCSGDELRLTTDADGILILAVDAPLGTPLSDLYGDVVLDVDVKPNRGDALSLVGLAREVAAATGATIRFPASDPPETGDAVDAHLSVEVRDTTLCSRFVGRWIDGVRVGPSPETVQRRLLAAGLRPVSNVVDASNYVMWELGKPIHTFDAAAVGRRDGRAVIVVRRAGPGELLETLDHVERELDPETLVIADPDGLIGIAGVMGGAGSEVEEGTTEVVVESAIFDPVGIRRTAQRHGLRSEASSRFEKGQEFRLARIGADRTARLIAEWAGGRVAVGRVDTNPDEPDRARVLFRPARVSRLLGADVPERDQRGLLGRVGIEVEAPPGGEPVTVALEPEPLRVEAAPGEALAAVIPTWRRDLAIEADITEEVARVRGYETIPAVTPHTPMPGHRPNPLAVRDLVRETLVGAGLFEVATPALVSPALLETFPFRTGDPGEPIVVTNPLSRDHSVLRQNLVGSLLEIVSSNLRHGRDGVAIFEVGKGYARDGDRPLEWLRLGIGLAGMAEEAAWNRPARPADLDDAKGLVELIAERLGFGRPRYRAARDVPILHPGRAAWIDLGESLGGVVGELHPALARRLELRVDRVVVAELAIAGLEEGTVRPVRVSLPPRVPPSERDLAVVVPAVTAAASVEDAIRAGGGDLLHDVRLFDVYVGPPLAEGERSLAYRLVFQAADRTLTEAEVDEAVAAIIERVGRDAGGRIRA